METKTANLTNCLSHTALNSFNNWGGISYGDILSTYPKDLIENCWFVLSRFIVQNYQMGKGTFIKGLGTFTFTNIEYSLEGTTNQYTRDIKRRRPVFIVSPEFIEYLRPGQYTTKSGLMYYTQKINNSISICKANFALLSYGANVSKEEYVTIISTLIKSIGDEIRRGVFKEKKMPQLGTLLLKGNIFGMRFDNEIFDNSALKTQKLIHTKRNIELFMETKQSKGVRQKDIQDIDKAIRDITPSSAVLTHISPSAERWLRKSMDIDIRQLKEEEREDLKVSAPLLKNEYHVDQRFYREYPKQEIKGLRIPQDVLEAIPNKKYILLNEMKAYCTHENGMITKFEFICAFAKGNAHYKLGVETIRKIVDLYLKEENDSSMVDYKKLLNAIVRDINSIIKREYSLFPIDKYKHTIGANNKRSVSAYAFSSSSGNLGQRALNSIDNYTTYIDVNERDVKNDIIKIKKIIPYITRGLTRTISFLEMISILQSYSISISKPQMLKILKYFSIANPNAFSLREFLMSIQRKSFSKPNTRVSQSEINTAIHQLQSLIYSKGGIDFLFKETDSLSYDEFISRLSPYTKLTSKVLRAVYDYITSNKNELSKEDYIKHLMHLNEQKDNDSNFYIAAMKQISNKIFSLELKSDSYFDRLLHYNVCRKENEIALDEFERLMQLEHFNFSRKEIEMIFNYIDNKHDGVIDREEWNKSINSIPHPLVTMQNYIRRNKLNIEDIAYSMGINLFSKDKNSIFNEKYDKQKFKLKMKQIDENFSNEFIYALFDAISNGKPCITPNTIFSYFDIYKNDSFRSISPSSLSQKVKSAFNECTTFRSIISEFQKYDGFVAGKISLNNFLNVIHHALSWRVIARDVLRFAQMNKKVDLNMKNVYYHELCEIIFSDAKEDTFIKCIEYLKRFLREECNNDLYMFFVKMNNMNNSYGVPKFIKIEKLYEFFRNQVDMLHLNTINKFDIDGDGVISFDDMSNVIKKYIDKEFFDNKKVILQNKKEKHYQMTIEGYKKIVTMIKAAIKKENMTEVNLFQFLDEDQDGFISKNEFTYKINQLPLNKKLTQNQISEFYSHLDNFGIGKVNIETFLSKFQFYTNNDKIYKGNYTIEHLLLSEFSKWMKRNSTLSDTELLSLLDKDHDGEISVKDFKEFALLVLRLPKEEVSDVKIAHFIRAISITKDENVSLVDMRKLVQRVKEGNIEECYRHLVNMCNEGVSNNNKDSEWISEVIDRIGMFISENYESVDAFYNSFNDDIDLRTFTFFIEKNYEILNGYNVGKKEINVLFNAISSNEKTISKKCLNMLFNNKKKYDYYTKMHNDINHFINNNFHTSQDAFKYFQKVKPKENFAPTTIIRNLNEYINKKEFFNGLNYLFPNKFKTNTLLKYISLHFPKCTEGALISYSEFSYVYFNETNYNSQFSKTMYNPSRIFTSRPIANSRMTINSPFNIKDHPSLKTPFDSDPLEKIKRLILSSKVNYKKLFNESIVNSGNGLANQFEFKNILKCLDLGLTNIEIEDIISHCGITREGYINLVDFFKYLSIDDTNTIISREHILAQLKEIKQLIYKYYSNPRLAFTLNDKEIKSQIDFDKFKKIILDLYKRDSKQCPNYGLLKYVYDYIDVRKDGLIDLNEWSKVFSTAEGTLDIKANKKKLKVLREWENSSDIIEIYKMIARNKKVIKDKVKLFTFGSNSTGGMFILGENLILILKEVLGKVRLSHTQWKMLLAIGDKDKNGMIDFNMFMDVVEVSVKMVKSHPIVNNTK